MRSAARTARGKSTLMKIISGVYARPPGAIVYKGDERSFASPLEAEAVGIAIIHQELNLVPHLTVAENIYLAREPRRGFFVDRKALRGERKKPASTGSASPSIRIGMVRELLGRRSARWWRSPRRCR